MPIKSTLLTDTISTAPLPRDGVIGVPQTVQVQADATQEYLSASPFAGYQDFVQTLDPYASDIERELDPDIYRKILLDPHAKSSLMLIIIATFKNKLTVTPATSATDTDTEDSIAEEIDAHCEAQLAGLDTPIERTLFEMERHALTYGHSLAETVVEEATSGEFAGKWRLKAINPKPRENYRFVRSGIGHVIGVLPVTVGGAAVAVSQLDDETAKRILPRDKCPTLTIDEQFGDPRGNSWLRPAYKAWWLKTQVLPEWLAHVSRFGSPFIVGTTAPGVQPGYSADNAGNLPTDPKKNSAETKMATAIRGLRNGGFMVKANGSGLEVNWPQGAGEVFKIFVDYCKNEIVQTILLQTLATQEGQHQARAASETHMDVLTMFIDWLKSLVCDMVRAYIFKPLVRANYGDDIADKYTPNCHLGTTTEKDSISLYTAIASLFSSGYVEAAKSPTIDALDEELGLPARPEPTQQTVAPIPDPNAAPIGGTQPPVQQPVPQEQVPAMEVQP